MKIHPAGADFAPYGWTDRRTGRHNIRKLIIAFQNFENAPKSHRQRQKLYRCNRYSNFIDLSCFNMKEVLMAVS